jgi:hypothetical protein
VLSSIVQFVYCFGFLSVNSPMYYLIASMNGISLCLIDLILISLPMILIRNLKGDYYAHPYATYSNLIFLCWNTSSIGHHLLNDFLTTRIIFFSSFGFVLIFIALFFLGYLFLKLYSKFQNQLNFTVKILKIRKHHKGNTEDSNSSTDSQERPSIDFKSSIDGERPSLDDILSPRDVVKGQESKAKICFKFMKLIIYIPLDLIIFIVMIVLILGVSGVGNIILFYSVDGENVFKKNLKVYLLPFLTVIFSISMYFSFPEASRLVLNFSKAF